MKNTICSRTSILRIVLPVAILLLGARLTAGGDVLRLPDGGLSSSLNGALVSLPGSVETFALNPAGLAMVGSQQYTGMFAKWAMGYQGYYGAFTYPVDGLGTFAGNVKFLTTTFKHLDSSGNIVGNLTAESGSVVAGFGRSISGKHFGINVKYVFDAYQGYRFHTLAADAGAMMLIPANPKFDLNLGVALRNLGVNFMKNKTSTAAAEIPMPLNAAVGATLSLKNTEKYSVNAIAELGALLASFSTRFTVGVELGYKSMFFARGAYSASTLIPNGGTLSGGIGIKVPMKKFGKSGDQYDLLVNMGWISFDDQFGQTAGCYSVSFIQK